MTRFFTLAFSTCFAVGTAFSQPATDHINTGNPARPFGVNTYYKYGLVPSNLPTTGTYGRATDAATAYNYWVQDFVEDCGDGSKRVKFDQIAYTVSEGIAYGMLLAAYAGDKETFDGLWAFYKKFKNANGVMQWKTTGCTSATGGGATDAELDAAMALVAAAVQWTSGTYATDAKTLITAIRTKEMTSAGDTKGGDGWQENSQRNPSYYAPAYYRQFANIDTDNANFWSVTAVQKAEWHVMTNRHPITGLVSNWSNYATAKPAIRSSGNVVTLPDGTQKNTDTLYGYESIRNPWRMATDVLWNGNAAIAGNDICTKVAAFMVNKESNVRILMNVDGTPITGNAWATGTSYMTSLAAMGAANQASLNKLYSSVVTKNGRIDNNNLNTNSNYFSATLRCITLFMMTGNFWNPSDAEFPRTSPATAIDFTQTTQNVVVYPSPASTVVNIETAQEMQKISIINSVGVKVLEQSAQSQHETIDVSNLATGVYFVRIELQNTTVEHARFVKQ
ncbi:MAG: T9SS type A sorting domain-containing protein [Bacteroidales bacterium]|jgi:endo-1,4-beta-D-glucanase Y|nr:T9SS type A sorting domain-containing protein [Bacteroidales bacterium]